LERKGSEREKEREVCEWRGKERRRLLLGERRKDKREERRKKN